MLDLRGLKLFDHGRSVLHELLNALSRRRASALSFQNTNLSRCCIPPCLQGFFLHLRSFALALVVLESLNVDTDTTGVPESLGDGFDIASQQVGIKHDRPNSSSLN